MTGVLLRDVEPTLSPLISEPNFKLLVWTFLGLGLVAFIIRISIRILCLRRLLVEDYLMMLASLVYTGTAVVQYLFVGDIYVLWRVSKGVEVPTADFPRQMTSALRAQGIIVILTIVGVWTIKLNYLFFFRRLTRQIRFYIILWRIVLCIVLASGAVNLGLIPYQCTFGSFIYVATTCATDAEIQTAVAVNKAGVGLNVSTDIMLIAFPIMILWPTKLRLSQKILLTGFFSFTLLTIGVTIVRGSVFGSQFYWHLSQITMKVMDFVWILLWYWVEFSVSIIIASLVSFRSLFTSREHKHQDERYERYMRATNHQNTIGSSETTRRTQHLSAASRKRVDKFYDSLLETVRDWEGAEGDEELLKYLPLVGITKTVDLSQRTSRVVREPGAGSRASQTALAAYCYYEESAKTENTAGGAVVETRASTSPLSSVQSQETDGNQIVKPEPVHIAGAR